MAAAVILALSGIVFLECVLAINQHNGANLYIFQSTTGRPDAKETAS